MMAVSQPTPTVSHQTSASLERSRRLAAEASGGRSNNAIYDAVLHVVAEFKLSGKLLDFGAGTGSLSRVLGGLSRFASVTGADLLDCPPDFDPANWLHADLNSQLPLPADSFDTIIAAEVIEHLENPRAMVRELYRLLKPGGTAIISTPNNESWRSIISLLIRGHYVAFCNSSYPAHITALLQTDLERIIIEGGFPAPRFRFTDQGSIPGKPSLLWQTISGGILKGRRYSDNILAVCAKPGGSS
jgi:2-polyprenyl-3-methyl-5-hydroxy-6-metoxy-1,4-benzoquinol methylase